MFDERDPNLGGEVGNDVNRDGNPAGSSGTFGVLWDGGSQVWVDVDQDRSFADEPSMTNYKVNRDVRYFGTDNPATPVAERMPFVVQIDGKNKAINIGIVSGQHGTHVAGIIAANGMFGGAMSGAAPGAQLVSVRVCLFVAGCTAHALIEGMIYAAKNANVDVINMSIGGLPALNDGNNTRAVLYDRLIDQSNVQMFISAGNSGPGENTVGDPSVATKVMSVGTSITDATWESNYGSTAPAPGTDNQHPFSSRGPREDGGFKPNIIAPGAAISTTPHVAARWPGRRRAHAAARLLDAQRHLDGLAAGRRGRRAARQRRRAGRRPAPAGAAAPGDELVGPVHRRLRRLRAGQRAHPGRRGLGTPCLQLHEDGRHHLGRARSTPPSSSSSRRPASVSGSTTARA